MKKAYAVALLGIFLIRHFVVLFLNALRSRLGSFKPEDGAETFFRQFKEDHIFPIASEQAGYFTDMNHCVACGLCETLCEESAEWQGSLYRGPALLLLTHSRSRVDFEYAESYFQQFRQHPSNTTCLRPCPTRVPIARVNRAVDHFLQR